jgi:DNA-binding beta-propeller fold protein YncE
MRMLKSTDSVSSFRFVFALLSLVSICLLPVTGFTQETVSDSLVTSAALPKNQVVATIPLGSEPSGMVVSPDSKYVYATNFTSSFAGIVQVIDTTSNTITSTITIGNNLLTYDLAITPDGNSL